MTQSITRRRVLQTGVAAAAIAGLPHASWAAGPVVKLRILETTDLHVNIFPYDYYRDAGGMAFDMDVASDGTVYITTNGNGLLVGRPV